MNFYAVIMNIITAAKVHCWLNIAKDFFAESYDMRDIVRIS